MTLTRALAAIATAIALTVPCFAEDSPMAAMPDEGKASSEAMPALKVMPDVGRGAIGTTPDRLARTMRGVRGAAEAPLRGKLEQELFQKLSRSVVLIVAPNWLGSGSVVDRDGTILTNWHIVEELKTVGVIFKPLAPSTEPKETDAVEAKVLRIDQIADLALIKVASLPADVGPIPMGDPTKLAVGADVHAIGHPFGEAWSYTKGIVSQIRANYEWKTEKSNIRHKADVVQTQTPINPGNSGGPLLNDAGELVGVATFGRTEGTSINFAVASNEVKRFQVASGDRLAPGGAVASSSKPSGAGAGSGGKCSEPVKLKTARTKQDDATMHMLDADCNGIGDMVLIVPDDKSQPILLGIDANENKKIEIIYVDKNRDLTFDSVLYDTDEDGKPDLVGYDLDENLNPRRIELLRA